MRFIVLTILLTTYGFWSSLRAFSEDRSLPITFSNVAEAAGLNDFYLLCGKPEKDYILESMSGGAAFLDYDNDGWLDVYLINGSTLEAARAGRPGEPNRLYRNKGDGTFEDVTERSGTGDESWGMGVCTADIDGNGWVDLYLTNYGPNVLLLNQGDGTFSKADRGIANSGYSAGAAFADVERDGDLDLYVANYVEFDLENLPPLPGSSYLCKFRGVDVYCGPRGLAAGSDAFYRQDDTGKFVEATLESGMDAGDFYGLGVLWGDFDNNGFQDLYVANDSQANLLFLNRGDGTFGEDGLLAGVAMSGLGGTQAGMGVDAGDINNDGWLDLYVTNFSHDRNTLYVNEIGLFSDETAKVNLTAPTYDHLGWGTGLVDFDNDGWLDIFVANSHVYPQVDERDTSTYYRQSAQCFHSREGKDFVPVEQEALDPKLLGKGVAFGDYDNDGDVDVLMSCMEGPPVLLQNVSENENHWVQFLLRGADRNRSAIGARVEVRTPNRTQIREVKSGHSYLSQSDLRVHFGLGNSDKILDVQVRWPDGSRASFEGVLADRLWILDQQSGKAAAAVR